MLPKKYGELNKFISIMLMTKIRLNMRKWGPFLKKSSVTVKPLLYSFMY